MTSSLETALGPGVNQKSISTATVQEKERIILIASKSAVILVLIEKPI